MAEAAKPARILETRKTAPGLRLVDKWAVSTCTPLCHSVSGNLMPFRLLCPSWKGRSFLVVVRHGRLLEISVCCYDSNTLLFVCHSKSCHRQRILKLSL